MTNTVPMFYVSSAWTRKPSKMDIMRVAYSHTALYVMLLASPKSQPKSAGALLHKKDVMIIISALRVIHRRWLHSYLTYNETC